MEWYSKARYDVIKEKMHYGVNGVVEGRHGFIPLCKVIDYDNDVFVSIVGWRVASHEVNAPFTNGAQSS